MQTGFASQFVLNSKIDLTVYKNREFNVMMRSGVVTMNNLMSTDR